jgi:hypothetical protein
MSKSRKIILYFYDKDLKKNTPTIVICISRQRNHSLTQREKNCRRGPLRPKQDSLEDVKEFISKKKHIKPFNGFFFSSIC